MPRDRLAEFDGLLNLLREAERWGRRELADQCQADLRRWLEELLGAGPIARAEVNVALQMIRGGQPA